MLTDLTVLLRGATAMGCSVAALFFWDFWRRSLDRFFLLFAIAFVILAVDYAILGLPGYTSEWRVAVFTLRLGAFALILLAIADKNRGPR